MNTPSNNTVHCIAPYRHPQSKSVWVFDDPRHGLEQEPFVGSANLPFDAVDAQLNAGGKLTAYFSTTPLPNPLKPANPSKTIHCSSIRDSATRQRQWETAVFPNLFL